jgi:hypothetical protein
VKKLFSAPSFWILLILLAVYTYVLAKPIDLTVADLGRHLVNGREIIQGNLGVLFKNTYSFTMPEQPFVNHHWLSGVIFYLVYSLASFSGLHIFHTLTLLTFLGLFFYLLKASSSRQTALFLSLLAILLLASRTEVRPESFGLVLLTYYLMIVDRVRRTEKLTKTTIFKLLTLQIVWTNFHISFIFGPFVFGLYWLSQQLQKQSNQKLTKALLITCLSLTTITIINPNGLLGSLAPLAIFSDYGYRVFENQNLLFLKNWYPGPIIPLYFLLSLALLTGLVANLKASLFNKLLAAVGIILGFIALRNLPIFVLFTFPLLANYVEQACQKLNKHLKLTIENPQLAGWLGVIIAISLTLLVIHSHPVFGKKTGRGTHFGLVAGQKQMMSFLKNITPQKMFNNYDVGSALILAYYPENKVFVDNRPEAFSADFFQRQYIPMQESETRWQESLKRFQFDYLVIGHRDLTSWTQTFLKKRLADNEWQLIYQDSFLTILARDIPANQAVIEKYSQ